MENILKKKFGRDGEIRVGICNGCDGVWST